MSTTPVTVEEILAAFAANQQPHTAGEIADLIWRERGIGTPKVHDYHTKPLLQQMTADGHLATVSGDTLPLTGHRANKHRKTATFYLPASRHPGAA